MFKYMVEPSFTRKLRGEFLKNVLNNYKSVRARRLFQELGKRSHQTPDD